ncbi:hypothetical protein PR202_gb02829 [Eleusine coracana subsp. coracana]|uniref:BHLH domain-containing protein n=1 Tax=Eleusine coracana subsp. coracana TaxID=191504 RepID=A0AAV5DXT7_ELECO|nr:hypothetical protein PR202_gb02829 [Eleusine coracana subsp. coracana]
MGLQGDKATHDFLSLYSAAKDSALPLIPESKKAPPSQGFFLKTHDFLQPLERPSSPPPAQQPAAEKPVNTRHALPGGVGTFSISRPAAADLPGAVKQEPAFALWGQPEPRGHPWSLPFAAAARCVAVASARPQPAAAAADAAGAKSGRWIHGRCVQIQRRCGLGRRRWPRRPPRELNVRVDTKGGSCSGSAGTAQLPNTPRSKPSATEQRRRSKINDRFQILREILPQNDQKRDKASFLLEVIEYIRFLQEKVQKYEVSHQEWNQENAKVMPWSNIYFRSFWKNAQVDKKWLRPIKRAVHPTKRLTLPVTVQNAAQLTKPLPAEDSAVNSEMLKDPELTIDEGTISLSSQYSQGLLATLNHALQNSGVDLSQASISVQINLGKRQSRDLLLVQTAL